MGRHLVWAYDAIADNIVWGNDGNIVWGNAADDNVVWGNDETDNLVWGVDDNIVWGNTGNIVWGNSHDDNIVWGNSHLREVWAANVVVGFWDGNIVWGNITRATKDNIVWGDGDDNIVWGNCLAVHPRILSGATATTSSGVTAAPQLRSGRATSCGAMRC